MKYTQFLELEKLLEANNTHIDEFAATGKIELVKEADEYQPAEAEKKSEEGKKDTIETKKGNILTKKGRMRIALNSQAKKMQQSINKDVAEKFIKPLIDQKVKVYQKMAEIGKGKQPKEILTALKGDLKNVKNITDKQVSLIEKTAQGVVDNYAKKIESALSKKGFKDTSLADLQSYWTLLSAQVMNNLLAKLAKLDDETIDKTITDKGILNAAKLINKEINKGLAAKLVEKDGEIKGLKAELKKKIDAEKKEEPAKEPAV